MNLGSLAAGTATNIQLVVYPTLPPTVASGQIENDFQVFGNQTDPHPANNFFFVLSPVVDGPVDVALSLVGAPNPVAVGGAVDVLVDGHEQRVPRRPRR